MENKEQHSENVYNYSYILEVLVRKIFIVLASHPLIGSLIEQNSIIKNYSANPKDALAEYMSEKDDVKFIAEDICKIKTGVDEIIRRIRTLNDDKLKSLASGYKNTNIEEFVNNLDAFENFMNKVMLVLDSISIEYGILSEVLNEKAREESFLLNVTSKLPKQNNKIENNIKYFLNYLSLGEDKTMFDEKVYDVFKESSDNFFEKTNRIINQFSQRLQAIETKPEKIEVKVKLSKEDVERINFINKVNEMYEEFVNSTLIDLKNQYSEATRDMYKNFVEVDFPKFCNKYAMPLNEKVTLGHARNVQYELIKLMEKVENISHQSYIISDSQKELITEEELI